MSNSVNIGVMPPAGVSQKKEIEVEIVKVLSLPSFVGIDESEDYDDILSDLCFGATEIGKASSIDYSGFGAIDDGCKRK